MSAALVLAAALALGAPEPETPGELEGGADGPWGLELIVVAEPEQPQEVKCAPTVDCLTSAKAYFGGALRAAYREPEAWSLVATLGLATLVDQEERPPSYAALTLRIDLQFELGRGREDFGAALRVSPVAALGWAEGEVGVVSDLPGFALVLGTARLWGEVGVRTLPTPADPRGFHLACGFVIDRWSGTAGLGTFATLGYDDEGLGAAGASIGAYGDVTVRVTERFDLRLMAIAASPVLLSLGFGWRFPP